MKEKTKIVLTIGGILLLIVGTISISMAFLSVSKKQELANTFTSGCLNISIENESNAITLSNTYPISDVEGLNTEGYTFTIKNTCSTSTNYMINLESLNQVSNTLNSSYIKVSLSSNTMDNLISKLNSNVVVDPTIEGAYEAYNLYKGTIDGNTTKEFNLKIWIDYDTTKEQGANKTYTSKINVIANPDLEVPNTPEIKTTLVDNKIKGNIYGLDAPERIKLVNIVNDKTNPFSYNEATGIYTSSNKGDQEDAYITFSLPKNYESVGICYEASGKQTQAAFLLDDNLLSVTSGENSSCIDLGNVTTESKIMAAFISVAANDINKLEFYVVENDTEILKYCTSENNICIPNHNLTTIDNKTEVKRTRRTNKEIAITALGNIEVRVKGKEIICNTINNDKTFCSSPSDTIAEPDFANVATTDEGIYKVRDGIYGGESYYWRGAATTNHVIFANKCWRIIRINGDGTIRLIYNGTVESDNTCIGNRENAESIVFTGQTYTKGGTDGRSEYVGYTYTEEKQRPDSSSTIEESNLKAQTDTWYNNNIGNYVAYAGKVADGKFCNDRNTITGYTWASQPNSSLIYAANARVAGKAPTLSCDAQDIYTLKAGAITADEVAFAGGTDATQNTSYYLYNGQYYWTMTPRYFTNSHASLFIVSKLWSFDSLSAYLGAGIRPVINLKSDTTFTGIGTQDKPYIVVD